MDQIEDFLNGRYLQITIFPEGVAPLSETPFDEVQVSDLKTPLHSPANAGRSKLFAVMVRLKSCKSWYVARSPDNFQYVTDDQAVAENWLSFVQAPNSPYAKLGVVDIRLAIIP